jgi:hypothetical protein
MPLSTADQGPQPEAPDADAVALDIDVQTALALSRANLQALKTLSPYARHAVEDALEAEIALQALLDGVVPRIVSALLREELGNAA